MVSDSITLLLGQQVNITESVANSGAQHIRDDVALVEAAVRDIVALYVFEQDAVETGKEEDEEEQPGPFSDRERAVVCVKTPKAHKATEEEGMDIFIKVGNIESTTRRKV